MARTLLAIASGAHRPPVPGAVPSVARSVRIPPFPRYRRIPGGGPGHAPPAPWSDEEAATPSAASPRPGRPIDSTST